MGNSISHSEHFLLVTGASTTVSTLVITGIVMSPLSTSEDIRGASDKIICLLAAWGCRSAVVNVILLPVSSSDSTAVAYVDQGLHVSINTLLTEGTTCSECKFSGSDLISTRVSRSASRFINWHLGMFFAICFNPTISVSPFGFLPLINTSEGTNVTKYFPLSSIRGE